MLAKTCRHWASKSASPTSLPPRSVATWPAMNRNSDALTRVIWEYWPSGLPSTSGLWIVISGMMAPGALAGCNLSLVWNDRQQQVRGMPGIVIDAMQHRLAAADVIGDVLDIGGAADTGCHVETRDLDADAVLLLELVGGCHDLDGVFVDLARHDGLVCRARQWMPGPAGQRSFLIDRPVGGLEPAAGELAFVQTSGDVTLTFPRGLHADVGSYVLEDDDPVGIVLVDRGVEIEHARARDGKVLGERLAQIAQHLNSIGLARRHLRERVGSLEVVGARRRKRLCRQTFPATQIEFDPSRLRQRPVTAAAPFIGAHDPEPHRRLLENSGIDPLEPLVVPTQHLATECSDRPVEVGGAREQKFLRRCDVAEPVLRSDQVGFVCVAFTARAGIGRHRGPAN